MVKSFFLSEKMIIFTYNKLNKTLKTNKMKANKITKKVDRINKDHECGEKNSLEYSRKMRELLHECTEKGLFDEGNYLINNWIK